MSNQLSAGKYHFAATRDTPRSCRPENAFENCMFLSQTGEHGTETCIVREYDTNMFDGPKPGRETALQTGKIDLDTPSPNQDSPTPTKERWPVVQRELRNPSEAHDHDVMPV